MYFIFFTLIYSSIQKIITRVKRNSCYAGVQLCVYRKLFPTIRLQCFTRINTFIKETFYYRFLTQFGHGKNRASDYLFRYYSLSGLNPLIYVI